MTPLQNIQASALRYLAQREHTQLQLKQKLTRKFPEHTEAINTVLASLQQDHQQDDRRYIESLIRSRVNKGYGSVYIQQSLQQQKLDPELCQRCLEEAHIDWLELAKTVYRKKYRDTPATTSSEKAKRYRFLQSRGFAMDVIKKISAIF